MVGCRGEGRQASTIKLKKWLKTWNPSKQNCWTILQIWYRYHIAGNVRGRKLSQIGENRGENFCGLLPFPTPTNAMPPNFAEKTFTNSHKTAKFMKVFSLKNVFAIPVCTSGSHVYVYIANGLSNWHHHSNSFSTKQVNIVQVPLYSTWFALHSKLKTPARFEESNFSPVGWEEEGVGGVRGLPVGWTNLKVPSSSRSTPAQSSTHVRGSSPTLFSFITWREYD